MSLLELPPCSHSRIRPLRSTGSGRAPVCVAQGHIRRAGCPCLGSIQAILYPGWFTGATLILYHPNLSCVPIQAAPHTCRASRVVAGSQSSQHRKEAVAASRGNHGDMAPSHSALLSGSVSTLKYHPFTPPPPPTSNLKPHRTARRRRGGGGGGVGEQGSWGLGRRRGSVSLRGIRRQHVAEHKFSFARNVHHPPPPFLFLLWVRVTQGF